MALPIYHVDAFADSAFAGNPAAVCLLDDAADPLWMQRVAAEMMLSETAFLRADGNSYLLRWFTPVAEVDLCGHATLASAHILYETLLLRADQSARFKTLSGELVVQRADEDLYELNFPSRPPFVAAQPEGLDRVLGFEPAWSGRSHLDLFVEAKTESNIRSLKPDFNSLIDLNVRGLIVTAQADADKPYDVVSRFFAPALGIPEDPVTGAAHCAIGPYWATKLGQDTLVGYQASARGGLVRMRLADDRIILSGKAVTVVVGELLA